MAPRNEVVEAALGELSYFGLKGCVEDRGKHVEVRWEHSGGSRFVICSKTSSDVRAVLNCRALVRRLLRADGVTVPQAVPALQKALALPAPAPAPAVRVERLEKQCEALLDMISELSGQVSELTSKLSNLRVTAHISFDPAPTEAPKQELPSSAPKAPVLITKDGRRTDFSKQLLGALSFQTWIARSDLLKQLGGTQNALSTALNELKKRGLVENGLRGYWRRIRLESVPTVPSVVETPINDSDVSSESVSEAPFGFSSVGETAE